MALSYNLLQEDSIGESLIVLRQISNQTAAYILYQGTLLNTTAILPSPPAPFEPSTAAIVVNSLWFASLIVSLATASFGILIKQWLREYMACKATTSPQGRMRLRHFRSPGLETWKVFEIAAALPLLIQLSLALFFVGLCAFTADAHPTVGRTTLPLVIAWALFFCIVLICPMFSARCPYKTPFLIGFISQTRARIYPPLVQVGLRLLGHSTRGSLLYRVALSLSAWARKHTADCDSRDRPYDESDALKYTGKDLDILASADALQLNDELLGTAMQEAVLQSHRSLSHTVVFVLKVLMNRVPQPNLDLLKVPHALDLRLLTKTAWNAVTEILAHVCGDQIQAAYRHPQSRWSTPSEAYIGSADAADWAICILISPAQDPLSSVGFDFLGRCLLSSSSTRGSIAELCCRSAATDVGKRALRTVLASLCRAIEKESPDSLSAIRYIGRIILPCFSFAKLPCFHHYDQALVLDWAEPQQTVRWKHFLNHFSLGETNRFLIELLLRELKLVREDAVTGATDKVQDVRSMVIDHGIALIVRLWSTMRISAVGIVSVPLTGFIDLVYALDRTRTAEDFRPILLMNLLHEPVQSFHTFSMEFGQDIHGYSGKFNLSYVRKYKITES